MTRKRARKLCMSLRGWDRNETELYLDHVPLSNGATTYADMVEFALEMDQMLERYRIQQELEKAYMKLAGENLVLGFGAGIADGISKEKVL